MRQVILAWSWGIYIVVPPLDGLVAIADGPGPFRWRPWVLCIPKPEPFLVPA